MSILTVALSIPAFATGSRTDSVEISLLTCSPGTEVWSQFGHTAIRIQDKATGTDVAVNYGMFSSHKPHFILKFVFGLTDYYVDVQNFNDFLAEYYYEGRGVLEQRLNLSDADKKAVILAISDNLKPENKVYRYNFFYDNCTTRARDVIVDNLSSEVKYPPELKDSSSFRYMVHHYVKDYPWTQFGEDLLLGLPADWNTTKAEQQFLPEHLASDFDHTIYNGKPLVSSSQMILQPKLLDKGKNAPLSPLDVALVLLVLTAILAVIEYRTQKIFWGVDLFYMLLTGLPGIIITAMLFSEHPTVSLNLLILILNPLPLFVAYPAIKRTRQHRRFWWWSVWAVLIVACIIGSFFQKYPSGIIVLAFILLYRAIAHIIAEKKYPQPAATKNK